VIARLSILVGPGRRAVMVMVLAENLWPQGSRRSADDVYGRASSRAV